MDSMTVIIQLQEYQRIAVTRISGTGGGDGSATVMDVEANAVYDYSGNPNLANLNLQVTEIPDTVPPTIVSGQIDSNDGTLTFFASEALDVVPQETSVDLTKIRLQKTPTGFIEVAGATVIPVETDVVLFTL